MTCSLWFTGDLAAQYTFQKSYGHNNGGQLNSVIINNENQYVFAGWYDVEGLFSAEFYVMVTDTLGNMLWNQTYGVKVDSTANRKNGSGNEGFHIIQTKDGGYLFSGERHEIQGGTSDVFLVKLSNEGALEWSKSYGEQENEYGYAVRETADGGFAIGGFTESYGAGIRDFYLIRTNALGDTIWTRTYGGPSLDLANDMIITPDSAFLMVGHTFSYGAGNSDVYVVKADSNGNVEWANTYGGSENDIAHSVALTKDGNYLIAGETSSFGAAGSDVYLLKINTLGELIWSKTLGGESNENANAVIETENSNIIIAGSTESFGASAKDAYLVKTDSNGQLIWSHNYGGSFEENIYSVTEAADGGFLLSGLTRSYGIDNLEAYVVKTDSLGRTNCANSQSDYFSVNVPTISGSTTPSVSSGSLVKRSSTLTGNTNTIQTDICEGIVSVKESLHQLAIDIYPNPSDNILYVMLPDKVFKGEHFLSIYTIEGHLIEHIFAPSKKKEIDISMLNTGIYLLRVAYPEGSTNLKFVKI